jgi:hypothetical protein
VSNCQAEAVRASVDCLNRAERVVLYVPRGGHPLSERTLLHAIHQALGGDPHQHGWEAKLADRVDVNPVHQSLWDELEALAFMSRIEWLFRDMDQGHVEERLVPGYHREAAGQE